MWLVKIWERFVPNAQIAAITEGMLLYILHHLNSLMNYCISGAFPELGSSGKVDLTTTKKKNSCLQDTKYSIV